jgi:hypothetical protein
VYAACPHAISHYGYLHALAPSLVQNGHKVYSLIHTGARITDRAQKLGIIPIFYDNETRYDELKTVFDPVFYEMAFRQSDVMKVLSLATEIMLEMCEEVVHNSSLLATLRKIGIDVVVYDSSGSTPCALALPGALGVPFIGMSSNYFWWQVRSPCLPSFTPPILYAEATDEMSFWQRVKSLLMYIIFTPDLSPIKGFGTYTNLSLIQNHVQDKRVKTWSDLNSKVSLLLITRDEVLEWPYPRMSHVISIACITCYPAESFPTHIEEAITSNGNDVILVSFGTVIPVMPDYIVNNLFDAFTLLGNYFIIFRYAGGNIPEDIPKNVMVTKWLSQNNVFGHSRTKLFINHCGNNGQYESVYHGVPMVCLPIAMDQPHNARRMQVKKLSQIRH